MNLPTSLPNRIARLSASTLALAVVVLSSMASVASATGIDASSDSLPPAGVYISPPGAHGTYPTIYGQVTLSNIQMQPLTDQPIDRQSVNGGHDEIETFQALVSGDVSVAGFTVPNTQAIGSVSVLVHGYGDSQTGAFSTEMLSLSLTASDQFGSFMLRESPTIQSLGQTTITPIGGGQFHIDSFFDVFTELSLDNGATWYPDTSAPAHVTLSPTPEPSSIVLGLFAAAGLGAVMIRNWVVGD